MGLNVIKKIAWGCGCILLAALFGFILFLPLPFAQEGAAAEFYFCTWEDGAVTNESYLSACTDYAGTAEEGKIVLVRGGLSGEIVPSAAFSNAYGVLSAGNLAEILACDYRLERLGQFALYRTFADTLWCNGGEYFCFTGDRFVRTELRVAETLILLAGTIDASSLIMANIRELHLRPQAQITGETLVGTQVEKIVASEPYRTWGGAITLDTAVGKRLVAGMPLAKSVTVEDVLFADEGALLACGEVEALELPFLGNSPNMHIAYELAYLFSTGEEYCVPTSLKQVKVRGGTVATTAFFHCEGLREIDLCGLSAGEIAPDAFLALGNLQLLHTPRADVRLAGNYTQTLAPCGCTVFRKAV